MAEVEVGMRILVIADIESKALWDYFDKSMLENVDLIVSCGDLNPKSVLSGNIYKGTCDLCEGKS